MPHVGFDQPAHFGDVLVVHERFQVHHLMVAQSVEDVLLVEDVGDAAAHARGEVAPDRTDDDHAAAGHVFAAVVADAFDDGLGAAVPYAEALAGPSAEKGLAAGGAVEGHVADDHVLGGHEAGVFRREDRHESARKALARVVV